ncbi:TPA: FGGY family carbohydrate kinase [Salmonella enterica]|uniref:ATP:glycerol 3-phosphotransferase n=2 Tax=Salmonella enterica TaxID=28901 RepID=A0A3V8I7V9_SALER|nr:FGGY-family carbohydrate kinase [Salmonella enterica]EBF8125695.1 glycerol kinase GlpK [Salmonella enterica subsp. enterica]EBU7936976.1 carbohydrate kinase [Salmonella enterica subsp. enterica serovar Chittagong]EBY5129622.1 glycerol kinase GlpK [Salmonella enterica subsp. enterica serovar Brazzaville]ECC9158414.1 carbohydrate kinase [Salmonella enterica subsp. salamae]EDH3989175.1 glycerol kinase GlpK [Salmonella enterica subsp. enterica serovar Westminster]EEE2000863.1 glycerol kinase G
MEEKKDVIIALDEGTTNAKAIAIDGTGKVLARSSQALAIKTPREGWVEQSGEYLVEASLKVMRDVIEQVGSERVAGIAISNQRETTIGWYRKSGKPLGAAITWQCSRTAEYCERLRNDNYSESIQSITGLPIAPLFSGSKMRWLLDTVPNGNRLAEEGEICLGTIDSWLLWNLTGGDVFACDYSNASRTQLFNIHEGAWDKNMLSLFQIPEQALPEIKPSSGCFGYTRGLNGITDGIPVLSMIGDSHAALYGHAKGQAGCVKATYGTGSSVMAPVISSHSSISSLATTVSWNDGVHLVYGLEGNIPHTGDAIAWMADSTGLSELSAQELSDELNTLPATVESTLGVYFVPALTGLGAPWWDENARGIICGLSRGVKRAHLVRAALESITYQIADVVLAMRQHADFQIKALMVDGGPTKNDWLMQYQADLLGCPVMRSNITELSAMGAGLLARKALDHLSDEEMLQFQSFHTEFKPNMERHGRLQKRWREWQVAVERTRWMPA